MSLVAREAWLPVDMASSPKRADPPRGLPHASPSGASDASAEDWVVAMHSADDASGSAVRRPRCILMKSCYFHRRMLCHLSLQYPLNSQGFNLCLFCIKSSTRIFPLIPIQRFCTASPGCLFYRLQFSVQYMSLSHQESFILLSSTNAKNFVALHLGIDSMQRP